MPSDLEDAVVCGSCWHWSLFIPMQAHCAFRLAFDSNWWTILNQQLYSLLTNHLSLLCIGYLFLIDATKPTLARWCVHNMYENIKAFPLPCCFHARPLGSAAHCVTKQYSLLYRHYFFECLAKNSIDCKCSEHVFALHKLAFSPFTSGLGSYWKHSATEPDILLEKDSLRNILR